MPPFDAITPVLLDPAAKNPGDNPPLTICPASKGGSFQTQDAQIIIPELKRSTLPPHGWRRWTTAPPNLSRLNMDLCIDHTSYKPLWNDLRAILSHQLDLLAQSDRAIIMLVEGWDAGGKSGMIRRAFKDMPNAPVDVQHIIAPTQAELQHHFLYRFRDLLPKPGQLLVLDRSWYGRLLVERVDELTPEGRLFRSIDEINLFEHALTQAGTTVLKFWLHVSKEEQRQRLSDRALDPDKRHKFKPSDIRNFHQRASYEDAADDMLHFTSTPHAPWHLIAADSKPFARLSAITKLIQTLEQTCATVQQTKAHPQTKGNEQK